MFLGNKTLRCRAVHTVNGSSVRKSFMATRKTDSGRGRNGTIVRLPPRCGPRAGMALQSHSKLRQGASAFLLLAILKMTWRR